MSGQIAGVVLVVGNALPDAVQRARQAVEIKRRSVERRGWSFQVGEQREGGRSWENGRLKARQPGKVVGEATSLGLHIYCSIKEFACVLTNSHL